MEQIHIERLDHLGVIASVIKDLGLISMIDTRLVPDKHEVITPGEPVAAMIHIERLDPLGVIASVIKDLGLISMIDTRLVPDKQEVITPGEAVAAMILNGLGFANRPLSLTPQFFASKPLDLLFRAGINAEMFNRFKLGRTLDEASAYG